MGGRTTVEQYDVSLAKSLLLILLIALAIVTGAFAAWEWSATSTGPWAASLVQQVRVLEMTLCLISLAIALFVLYEAVRRFMMRPFKNVIDRSRLMAVVVCSILAACFLTALAIAVAGYVDVTKDRNWVLALGIAVVVGIVAAIVPLITAWRSVTNPVLRKLRYEPAVDMNLM